MTREEKEALVRELGKFVAEKTAKLERDIAGLHEKIARLEIKAMSAEERRDRMRRA